MPDKKFNFNAILKDWQKEKKQLAKNIAKNTLKYFERNYLKQGYEEEGFTKWQPKKYYNGKPILINTGKLRRSIKIVKTSFQLITIATSVPYGKYHQEGTNNMVRRPFLYNSKKLENGIQKTIDASIRKILG